ncbi:MAG: thioredoxin family protein [Chloroflexota bacterium]
MALPVISLTPQRFAQGMTFTEYLSFIASPANLGRDGYQGRPRVDNSAFFRERYERTRLTEPQEAAIKWICAQPGGPAKIVMLSEEWSSDCRRDVPVVQRLAEAGGMELRIFTRDTQQISGGPTPEPSNPNADLIAAFLRRRDGETFQSIPVVAFFDRDFRLLYHYTEFAACYRKDRLRGHQGTPRPGESAEQAATRAFAEFQSMLASPMFDVWATAGVAEMISMLYERVVVGSLE